MAPNEPCAVCRDPVTPPTTSPNAVYVCVTCWFSGDGKEYWDAHRSGDTHLVVSGRADGETPEAPSSDAVEMTITFEAERVE